MKKIRVTTEQFESMVAEYTRTLKDARKNKKGTLFSKNAVKTNPLRFRPAQREGKEDRVLYSAVVLSKDSHNKLLEVFADLIPEGWRDYAHHMTIVFGKGLPEDQQQYLDQEVTLYATDIGIGDNAIAVKVDGYPTTNKIPHITIAVSPEGKPSMSNQIENWQPLGYDLPLKGTVTEIKP